MKLIFISLCFAGALCVASAQTSATAPSSAQSDFQRRINNSEKRESIQEQLIKAEAELAELQKNYTESHPKVIAVTRRINDLEKQRSASDELSKAKDELAMLQLKYKHNHPAVVEQKARVSALENQRTVSLKARTATRLNTIVRRANTLPAGSIILNAPLKPDQIDELAEDLNIFKFLITRHLERTFGDQATEYRLGVPITMRDTRMVQLDYLQDFGLLVKVFVPFPVIPSGVPEKKPETPARQDTEWEKARRALLGGDTDSSSNIPGAAPSIAAPSAPAYDEKLIAELKTQMLHALKNAGNLRHVPDDQTILLAIIGAANPSHTPIDPLTGLVTINPDDNRSTVLTLRVKKNAASAAIKDEKAFENFVKEAQIATYTDTTAVAPAQPITGFGGGYSYGLPTTAPVVR